MGGGDHSTWTRTQIYSVFISSEEIMFTGRQDYSKTTELISMKFEDGDAWPKEEAIQDIGL